MSKQWQMEKDYSYQSDCLIYTIFSNHIISQYGTNHWIPFTEAEVEAKDNFESHFMSDFLHGKRKSSQANTQQDLLELQKKTASRPWNISAKPPATCWIAVVYFGVTIAASPMPIPTPHFTTSACISKASRQPAKARPK